MRTAPIPALTGALAVMAAAGGAGLARGRRQPPTPRRAEVAITERAGTSLDVAHSAATGTLIRYVVTASGYAGRRLAGRVALNDAVTGAR